MPRQKNTRPTNIYWLYDTRPETVAMFGPEGKPFYCGKTIYDPEERLRVHKYASIAHPNRKISTRVIEVGIHVVIRVVEIVSPENDWASRERYWINILRTSYSDTVNTTSGGEGLPGLIHSAESRAKMSAARAGTKHSAETRLKIGRVKSAEAKAKIGAANRGKIFSDEHRAKLRAAKIGKKRSPEVRSAMRLAQRARWAVRRANAETHRA